MWWNCKVIKKWQPPPPPLPPSSPPFQVYPSSSKNICTIPSPPFPSDSIFGRSYPPLIRGEGVRGGVQLWKVTKMVFLRKSCDLSEICVKSKILWFINILWKLHPWRKSGSQVIAKNGSQPVRFQHSLIVNISLIDKYLTLIFGM